MAGKPAHYLLLAATLNKKIPTVDTKRSGVSTYPEWVLPLQGYLYLLDITGAEHQVWDVVGGTYEKPASTANRTKQWIDANIVALLTIRKNCKDRGPMKSSKRHMGKGPKVVTELGQLMKSITTIVFDDRKATMKEHIAEPGILLLVSYPDSTSLMTRLRNRSTKK